MFRFRFVILMMLLCGASHGISLPDLATGWEKLAESTRIPSVSNDGMIDGVNIITGTYTDHAVDLVTNGIEPYTWQRYYSRHSYRPEIYESLDRPNHFGWHVDYDRVIWYEFTNINMDWVGSEILLSELSGGLTRYVGHNYYQPDSYKGYMNHTGGTLSGQNHLRNTSITIVSKNDFRYVIGDGTERVYSGRGNFRDEIYGSGMTSEHKPSGNFVRLVSGGYDTYNADGSVRLNYLRFSSTPGTLTATSSDQRSCIFRAGPAVSRNDKVQSLMGEVVRPDGSLIRYRYDDHYKGGNDFLLGKYLPDGRALEIKYENNLKAASLHAPVGVDQTLLPKYKFWYGNMHTMVEDAMGHYTRYEYDSDSRIHRVMRYKDGGNYRYEQNVWSGDGCLEAKVLLDGSGIPYLARKFGYDGSGNVAREKIYGILTGDSFTPIQLDSRGIPIDNGAEYYEKTYSYSNDRFNLLRGETDGVASTEYLYYPNTNLLKAKLIYDKRHIHLRQFRQYDKTSALALLVEDDGSGRELDDLTGCTQRKIISITNNFSGYGVGQPAMKEEKYYDFKEAREVVLKKIYYTYNQHNECIQEDVYEASGSLLYAIRKAFDAMGRCIYETDPLGNEIRKTYDANGNLLKQVGPRSDVVVEHVYDYSNRLISTSKRDGYGSHQITRYRYDLCGNKIAEIDDAGNETQYVYDALGRVMQIIYPPTLDANDHQVVSKVTKFYDLGDNNHLNIDENGYEVWSWYTIRGQPYRRVTAGVEERFLYDTRGNLVKKTHSDGSYTAFDYDFLDRVVRTSHISPQGEELATTTAEYTAFALIKATDAEGSITTITYDGAGREAVVCQGNSQVETTYTCLGFPEKVKRWHGEGKDDYTITLFKRDVVGHVLEERLEDAAGVLYAKKGYVYDAMGNCIQEIVYHEEGVTATTCMTYDGFGRLIEKRDPLGHVSKTQYLQAVADGLGGIGACIIDTDSLGNVKTSYFDARSNLVKETITTPMGKIASHKQFRYDGAGNRVLMKFEQTPEKWQEIRFTYGYGGKMTSLFESGRTTRMSYNPQGMLVHKENPLSTHTFEYDSLGRVLSHTAVEGKSHIELRYAYDRCGRTTLIEQDGKSTQRTYDSHGNVTHELQESGHGLKYAYDRLGRRTRMILPDKSSVIYLYQGPFLQAVQRHTPQGVVAYTHLYSKRDLAGKILESELCQSNGKLNITYDLAGQTLALSHAQWAQHVAYDSHGNLTQIDTQDTWGSDTCAFGYDSLHQLASENNQKYSYDGVGNPTDSTVGPCNQLTTCKSTSYDYDLQGRLTSSKGFTCSYDALDRMVSYNKTLYRYDGLNRRMSSDTNTYLYDGNREIGTINKKGELLEFRLLGEGRGAEIGATIAIELNGKCYATLSDVRGSVACLLNSGKTVECYRYTAFTETSHTFIKNPWRFSSKRTDPESGWVFFGRRYYSPTQTRFTTPDPLGYTDGTNLYTFTSNNPSHIDLYGYRPRPSPERDYDRTSGPLDSHNPVDFLGKLFTRTMACIEWIGQNLIPIPGARDIVEAIGRWGSGGKLLELAEYHTSQCEVHIIEGKKIDGLTVLWVNGVRNTLDESIEAATKLSQKLGGVQVTVLYNSTQGILMDLMESFVLKLFGDVTPVEQMIIDIVKSIHDDSPNESIQIHAHSQGGLHLKNASKRLDADEREQIEAVTYGSASFISEGIFHKATNYVSKFDCVPIIGDTLNYLRAVSGKSDNVIFLSPTCYNPLKEHKILGETYQFAMNQYAEKFRTRYL